MSYGSKKMCFLAAKSNQKDLEFIVKLVQESKIKPIIEIQYSLDKVADAIRYLSEGHARGKVVINMDENIR